MHSAADDMFLYNYRSLMCLAEVTQRPPLSSAAATDSSEQSSRMHMKEKNDIVMVETNSSSK